MASLVITSSHPVFDHTIDLESGPPQASQGEAYSLQEMETEEPPREHGSMTRESLIVTVSSVTVFLAFVVPVIGTMARSGETWKPVFLVVYIAWLVLLSSGIYIDLSNHSLHLARRALCHFVVCMVMFWLIASTTKPAPEDVVFWIPMLLNAGLGASIGLQSIDSNRLKWLSKPALNLLGIICGSVQIFFQNFDQNGRRNENEERRPLSPSQELNADVPERIRSRRN